MQLKAMTHEDLIDPGPIPGEELDDDDRCMNIEGLGAIPPDALKILLAILIPKRKATDKINARLWKTATVRLAIMAHTVDLDGIGGLTLTQLADELGVSRATLSHSAINLRDGIDLPRRGGKSDAAREVYSQRARRVWQRRKSLENKG
jgi:hypothetical protein